MNAKGPEITVQPRRLIRLNEVLQMCALSRATLYRGIKNRTFPAPIKLSARSVAWLHAEVTLWVDERVKERDSHEIAKP